MLLDSLVIHIYLLSSTSSTVQCAVPSMKSKSIDIGVIQWIMQRGSMIPVLSFLDRIHWSMDFMLALKPKR